MADLHEWIKKLDIIEMTGNGHLEVKDVISDSRKAGKDTVFVCIRGARADGHDFAEAVYEAGTRAFVVEDSIRLPENAADAVVIRVPDTRKAMALLAAERFGDPFSKMISIGVTGTKGKTTATTILKTALEACGKKVGLIGTTGCFIDGVHTPTRNTTPDSYELHSDFAAMVSAGCEYVVMECSSQGFKLDRTYGLRFDYGVFLNISPDHIGPDEHGSFDEYLNCKSMLLAQSEKAVVNLDDWNTERVINCSGISPERVMGYSVSRKADQTCRDVRFVADSRFTGTRFRAEGKFNGEIALPLPGDFNVSNTLAALTVLGDQKLPEEDCIRGIAETCVNGRMEVVFRNERFTVFVDYAHNEVSMVSLLKTLRNNYHPGRLVVLFGCGGNRSKDRRISMGRAAAESADFTVITSDNPRYEKPEDILEDIYRAFLEAGGDDSRCIRIPDRGEAIRYAMEHAEEGDMIAVIGKGHEDYIEQNGVRRHFLDREAILEEKEKLGL